MMIKIDIDFIDKLETYVENGWVSERRHSEYPWIAIYNYTNQTAFEGKWDDITLTCRGLIISHNPHAYDYKVLARPFKKFFNYDEHVNNGWKIPLGSYDVAEKVDGSLGIVYFVDGIPSIATRGSFNSEQAVEANIILRDMINSGQVDLFKMRPEYTYLVEIIYPENRIVVNYGDERNLYLLAVIDTKTGEDLCVHQDNPGFPSVDRHIVYGDESVGSFVEGLKVNVPKNKEGKVLRFHNCGTRMKVKYDEYVQLHRIITGITDKRIWEGLSEGKPLSKTMNDFKDFPDEIYRDTVIKEQEMIRWFEDIRLDCLRYYTDGNRKIIYDVSNRKEIAEYFKQYKYSTLLFMILDNKPVSNYIWKLIKQEFLKDEEKTKETVAAS
jgi:RNA ligase